MIAKAHVSIGTQNYRADIAIRSFNLIADEPQASGGQDLGPTALELVAGALGTCTSVTLRMYAQRKSWDLQAVEVNVEIDYRALTLNRTIQLTGALDAEQRARLMQIADACPVHKLLVNSVVVNTQASA
jgi:putative redox protein